MSIVSSISRSWLPCRSARFPCALAPSSASPSTGGRIHVTLASEVGVERLQFEKGADAGLTATLDVAMELTFLKPAARQVTPWREWKVTIPAEARGAAVWIPLEISVDLPPGICQAKLVVRDRGSRAVGSVLHGLDVPEPGTWRVSTPILSDVPGTEHVSPRLSAGRSFAAGTPVYCYFQVHNAARDAATAASRVSFAYALRDEGGKVRKRHAAAPLEPRERGKLERLLEIPLTELAPGDYALTLTIRDEVAGRTEEFEEPFSVRRPPRLNLGLYVDLVRAFLEGDATRALSGLMQWPPPQIAEVAATLPGGRGPAPGGAGPAHRPRDPPVAELPTRGSRRPGRDRPGPARGKGAVRPASRLAADPRLLPPGQRLPGQGPPVLHRMHARLSGLGRRLAGSRNGLRVHRLPGRLRRSPGPLPPSGAAAEAERRYREAVRLDPRLAEARLRLGRVLRLAGAFEEAERELAAAVDSSEEGYLTALAHLFWGRAARRRGISRRPSSTIEAALEADRECQPAAWRSATPSAGPSAPGSQGALMPALATTEADAPQPLARVPPRPGSAVRRRRSPASTGACRPWRRRRHEGMGAGVGSLPGVERRLGSGALPVFSSSIEVVRVDVSVTRDGRPVEGLKASDFEVRDNGVLQAVEIVGGADKPVDAVLALDVSTSVAGPPLRHLKAAAHALVDVLRPEDAVSLLTFSDRVQLRVSPADSRERAHEVIDGTEAQLTTALYDATYAALATADPARGRPLVLIFSDGQDVGSWLKPEQVLRVAEASELVVHAVLSRREETEVAFLRDLVASTGGQDWRTDFGELKDVMLRALDEFRSRYTLQYERHGATADGWHKLQVRVNVPRAEVRARKGYWQRTPTARRSMSALSARPPRRHGSPGGARRGRDRGPRAGPGRSRRRAARSRARPRTRR